MFPYQRLSLDAGILSHRNQRMLIPEDGGKRLMSGDRIRTSLASLALSVSYITCRVRQAEGWQSVSVSPGEHVSVAEMTQPLKTPIGSTPLGRRQ